jgi:hypothetical protein
MVLIFTPYRKILSMKTYIKDATITGAYFHGTVKIHGFHGDIIRDQNNSYRIQSKYNLLQSNDGNYNFYDFVVKNTCHFDILCNNIKEIYNITKEVTIMISGEWCGNGIKDYVAICQLNPMFIIFDIIINNTYYCDMKKLHFIHNNEHNIYNIHQFTTYTVYIANIHQITKDEKKIIQLYVNDVNKRCPVAAFFNISGPGEGIVFRSNHMIFKLKGKYFRKCYQSQNKYSTSEYTTNQLSMERLHNGIDYMNSMCLPITISNFHIYINYIVYDITQEEKNASDNILIKKTIYDNVMQFYKDYIV